MNMSEAFDCFEDGKRWGRVNLYSDRDGYCAMGALDPLSAQEGRYEVIMKLPAVSALSAVIREQYPDRLWGNNSSLERDIWMFNDDRETTFEDVRTVFHKAALQLGEEF